MSQVATDDLPRPGPLTEEQRELIKATIPVLAQHGAAVTRHFYRKMLDGNPDLKNVFSRSKQETGHQADALATSLYAYATHIDDLTPLLPVVERIAHKHASLHITPPQYATVGTYLLQSLTDVLGADVFTGALYDAWAAAYWQLAHIFIEREAKLYVEAPWEGWREFVLAKRVQESVDITSFYFEPRDGKPLPPYRPGQYTAVQKFLPELGVHQCRQYSLSDAPSPAYFRISVKREAGVRATDPASGAVLTADAAHPGWMSNLLHDTLHEGDAISLAAPYGDFFLQEEAGDAPIVFLAAGVGLTPLLAMLNAIITEEKKKASGRKVSWIQAVRSRAHHAFGAHVRQLAAEYPDLLATAVFYSSPESECEPGRDYDFVGRMDLDKVSPTLLHLGNARAQYYVCGPEGYMWDMARELKKRGVDGLRVHAEVFGAGAVSV